MSQQRQDDYLLCNLLVGLHLEELHARPHGAVGVAVACGEAVGAGLQLDGGGERSHAWVILEVECPQVAIL